MAITLSTPPTMDPMTQGGDPNSRGWTGWFHNLYDAVTNSQTLLDSSDAATSAYIALTSSITSDYKKYKIDLINLTFDAATSILDVVVSTDKGATYATGGSDYKWGCESAVLTTAVLIDQDGLAADSKIPLLLANVTNTANNILNGSIELHNPADTNHTMITWDIAYGTTGGDLVQVRGVGKYLATTPVNGIKIYPSSGNIVSGRFVLTGIN